MIAADAVAAAAAGGKNVCPIQLVTSVYYRLHSGAAAAVPCGIRLLFDRCVSVFCQFQFEMLLEPLLHVFEQAPCTPVE